MAHLDKTTLTAKELHTITSHTAILQELEHMLLELDREIMAYGRGRSMSLEVLRDLLEEDCAARLRQGIE